jgi:RNAse (barnase) inhibitor barstar
MRTSVATSIILLVTCSFALPLDARGQAVPRGGFDFTLIDAPYNTAQGLRGPSMRQTLDLSIATYEVAHATIQRLFGTHRRLGLTAVALFDVATTIEVALPLTSVWVHEEFHRTIMGRRGIDSFDDVYKLDLDATWIAVSHLKDDDLARMKREHPAEWIRTQSAGIEGELTLVRELERRRFFGQSRAWHLPLYWLTKLGTIGYVASGNWADADADIDQGNIDDGANVERRDFTGHDFLGWVYDLHRPNEPYAARGVHPSGVGIDRYIKRSDLTADEQRYLRRQGRLQLLNLVDPFLFGLNGGITVGGGSGDPTRINAGLGHFLTSFGHTVDANVLVRRRDMNMAVTLHGYANGDRVFPGVEGELFDVPVTVGGRTLAVSPRVGVWLQPEGQRFRTSEADAGGLAGLRVRAALSRRLGAFVDVEAKTTGWVAGVPYLDRQMTIRAGVSTLAR